VSDSLVAKAEARQKLITEGSLHKAFFILAGPAVATMSVEFILAFTDMIWVGKIGGPIPVAVVTSSMFSLWIIWSIVSVLTVGTVAVVSRHFGAKEFDRAGDVASNSIGYAVIAGLIVAVAGVILAPIAFKIMNTSPEVTAGGIVYLRIRLASALIFVVLEVFGAIFRASGDTKTPMIVMIIMVAANIVLDPVFIFGLGPAPQMGTAGAALASVIASVIGFIVLLLFIKQGKLNLKLNLTVVKKLDSKLIWKIIKIGLPLSISGILFSLVYFFINRIATQFGDEAVAAMGIGNRCESISFLICFGASMATSTLVGQNLGAKNTERAEKSGWVAMLYTGIFTLIISVLFITIPGTLSRIFIKDPTVESMVIDYIVILGLSQIFMAAEIVFEGAFSGAGDTMPPMIVGTSLSVLRIPLAYFLCFPLNLGPAGIWWSITLTSIVKGILISIWFRFGKWKTKKV